MAKESHEANFELTQNLSGYKDIENRIVALLRKQRQDLPRNHPDLLQTMQLLFTALSKYPEELIRSPDAQDITEEYQEIIQCAAENGDCQLLTCLLTKRTEKSLVPSVCSSVLLDAIIGGSAKAVKTLLDHGADAEYISGCQNSRESPLYLSAQLGHTEIVRDLLDGGADPNAFSGSSGTALHVASSHGRLEIVQLLVSQHAKIDQICDAYGTPLHAACIGDSDEVLKCLLTNGASANINVEPFGTPLQMATRMQNVPFMRILLDWENYHFTEPNSRSNGTGFLLNEASPSSSVYSGSTFLESEALSGSFAQGSIVTAIDQIAHGELSKLLVKKVLERQDIVRLSDRALKINGPEFFLRTLRKSIKHFSWNLYLESNNVIRSIASKILLKEHHNFANHFASRVMGWDIDSSREEDMLAHLPSRDQNIMGRVEQYLQTLVHQFSLIIDSVDESKTSGSRTSDANRKSSRNSLLDASELAVSKDLTSRQRDDNDSGSDDEDQQYYQESGLTMPLTTDIITWMKRSTALANFVYDLARVVLPVMEYVDYVLTYASFWSRTQTWQIRLPWGVVEYVRHQLNSAQEINTVLSLTGSPNKAVAKTCLDYCLKVWPHDGKAVLDALRIAIVDGAHDCELPSGTGLSFCLTTPSDSPNFVEVRLKGGLESVTQVVQQLAWLSSVFRVPEDGALSFSTILIHEIDEPSSLMIVPRKLTHVDRASDICWQPLFQNSVLALGFPVCSRQSETGVELPFAAMIQLSSILGPVFYNGGVVLKGWSSILYPVQEPTLSANAEPESVQWHLILEKDEGCAMLSLLNEIEDRWLCGSEDFLLCVKARTFLG